MILWEITLFPIYKVFQKEFYNGIANVAVVASVTKKFTLKGVQTIRRSRLNDILPAFTT
jgi:hypothetical protein